MHNTQDILENQNSRENCPRDQDVIKNEFAEDRDQETHSVAVVLCG